MTDNAFHLHIQSGSGAGQDHALGGPSLTIGRYPLADIVIDDPEVSYRHALLTRGGETYRIADLGSDAGTYVNGRRVGAEPVELSPGDIILLGTRITLAFLDRSNSLPETADDLPAVEATAITTQPDGLSDLNQPGGREDSLQTPIDPAGIESPLPLPSRLSIHDEPLPPMPPHQKDNNRRILLISVGCLLLLGCCCSATLFMYFIGGDWLLSQVGLLP